MSAGSTSVFDPNDLLTRQLQQFAGGDREIAETILRQILPELHRIATRELSRERGAPNVTPTELINEAWIRSLHGGRWTISSRAHFYSIAALAMRRALVDLARMRLAQRRNSGQTEISLTSDAIESRADLQNPEVILSVEELMTKLEHVDRNAADIAGLHYIVGYTLEEIAENTGLTLRQVRHRWAKARKWLIARLAF